MTDKEMIGTLYFNNLVQKFGKLG